MMFSVERTSGSWEGGGIRWARDGRRPGRAAFICSSLMEWSGYTWTLTGWDTYTQVKVRRERESLMNSLKAHCHVAVESLMLFPGHCVFLQWINVTFASNSQSNHRKRSQALKYDIYFCTISSQRSSAPHWTARTRWHLTLRNIDASLLRRFALIIHKSAVKHKPTCGCKTQPIFFYILQYM